MSSSENGGEQEQELDRLRELNDKPHQQKHETASLISVLQQEQELDRLRELDGKPRQKEHETASLISVLQQKIDALEFDYISRHTLDEIQMEQIFITLNPASQKRLLRWETKFIQSLERKFPKRQKQHTSRHTTNDS